MTTDHDVKKVTAYLMELAVAVHTLSAAIELDAKAQGRSDLAKAAKAANQLAAKIPDQF
jgi:hypothetical protein